jgi:hypothetical protein
MNPNVISNESSPKTHMIDAVSVRASLAYPTVCVCVCSFVCLLVCLCVCLFVHVFVCLLVCLSTCKSVDYTCSINLLMCAG